MNVRLKKRASSASLWVKMTRISPTLLHHIRLRTSRNWDVTRYSDFVYTRPRLTSLASKRSRKRPENKVLPGC